jgi:hypothetical protein
MTLLLNMIEAPGICLSLFHAFTTQRDTGDNIGTSGDACAKVPVGQFPASVGQQNFAGPMLSPLFEASIKNTNQL